MKIGQIIEEKDYFEAFQFINKNNLGIIAIKSADPKRRFFQIVERPKPTEKQIAESEIESLKECLAKTDYKAIKFAEGILTLAEYEPTREQRKQWREKINILENSLKNV